MPKPHRVVIAKSAAVPAMSPATSVRVRANALTSVITANAPIATVMARSASSVEVPVDVSSVWAQVIAPFVAEKVSMAWESGACIVTAGGFVAIVNTANVSPVKVPEHARSVSLKKRNTMKRANPVTVPVFA